MCSGLFWPINSSDTRREGQWLRFHMFASIIRACLLPTVAVLRKKAVSALGLTQLSRPDAKASGYSSQGLGRGLMSSPRRRAW